MNKKMRPIIKWTGGKYSEFSLFANSIPKFERYIEPFFGGGGVFFALQPDVKALINDKSTDLVNFYNLIGNPSLALELNKYADVWEQLSDIASKLWHKCDILYINYINNQLTLAELNNIFISQLTIELKNYPLLNQSEFIIDANSFKEKLLAAMADKAKRIKRISEDEQRKFNEQEISVHFETGLRSGVYLFFRSLLNAHYNEILALSTVKATANWYFVREFCYGSMFRFNSKGEFNIPYGGITYNKKNFRQKVANIFSKPMVNLFKEVEIYNLDFETFLKQIDLVSSDFIFLDPPYDSEFSEYDQNAFTKEDQKRLAKFLIDVKAKWMVVIKETAFIREIYDHPTIKIKIFYKNYAYNVRGRNDRKVQHLIITNY
jgi:DNA adenine methylase